MHISEVECNPSDLIKFHLRLNMQHSKVDGANPRLYTKLFNSTPANPKYMVLWICLPRTCFYVVLRKIDAEKVVASKQFKIRILCGLFFPSLSAFLFFDFLLFNFFFLTSPSSISFPQFKKAALSRITTVDAKRKEYSKWQRKNRGTSALTPSVLPYCY